MRRSTRSPKTNITGASRPGSESASATGSTLLTHPCVAPNAVPRELRKASPPSCTTEARLHAPWVAQRDSFRHPGGDQGPDLRISRARFFRVLRVSMLIGGAARLSDHAIGAGTIPWLALWRVAPRISVRPRNDPGAVPGPAHRPSLARVPFRTDSVPHRNPGRPRRYARVARRLVVALFLVDQPALVTFSASKTLTPQPYSMNRLMFVDRPWVLATEGHGCRQSPRGTPPYRPGADIGSLTYLLRDIQPDRVLL